MRTEEPIPYPGSRKTKDPREDPEHFVDWVTTHMPKSHKEFYTRKLKRAKEDREKIGTPPLTQYSNEHLIESPICNGAIPYSDAMAKSISAETPIAFSSNQRTEIGEINPFPDDLEPEYQGAQKHIEKWAIFRLYPLLTHQMETMYNLFHDTALHGAFENVPEPVLPSLFRYYNLLPEFARKNQNVINVVRAFEFTKHELSITQKELAVNLTCQFALPMEEGIKFDINFIQLNFL